MKGVIITNAYWDAACVTEQAERIASELRKAGAEADIVRNGGLFCSAGRNGVESALGGYDFCVYLDKDKYLSSMLTACGMRLFNTHETVRLCDDKADTYIMLAACGVPVPLTLPAPLCYTPSAEPRQDTLDEAERRLGYPMVVKSAYGSGGKGVYKADCRAELERTERALLREPHMFQEFIADSAGRDVRVIVVGGKAIGGMLRRSADGDFRSNLAAGGSGEPFDLDSSAAALCEKVADITGADYAGIDLLFTGSGFVVCEVNSNAFFGGFERACGINVARAYAEHILRVMTEGEGK